LNFPAIFSAESRNRRWEVHILAGNPRAEGGRRVLFYSGHDPMLLAISILAALYRRRDTGQGASASRSPCRTPDDRPDPRTLIKRSQPASRRARTFEHVHVYPGGQAIVGNVTHTGRGAPDKNEGQAHATEDKRAIAFAPGTEMRSPDEKREPCQSPAVSGKRRCRMHEGAHGSGAPKGERNGNYRHGFYTAAAIAERRAVTALIRKLAG
jgi:hypothetical protein